MSERWSNTKVAKIAYLLGQGHTAVSIAKALGDGTSSAAIRRMRQAWGLLEAEESTRFFEARIPLDNSRRADLIDQAEALSVSPTEFLRRVLVCVLDDDLYNAVNDGRFK